MPNFVIKRYGYDEFLEAIMWLPAAGNLMDELNIYWSRSILTAMRFGSREAAGRALDVIDILRGDASEFIILEFDDAHTE